MGKILRWQSVTCLLFPSSFQLRLSLGKLSAARSIAFRVLLRASQASDVGSIPIARSINRDDSSVLTPLTLLKKATKPRVLVPRWSQRNELVPTSQPEVRRRWTPVLAIGR